MFLIKIYIKESYINYYHTIIQMCGQYCILAPRNVHSPTIICTALLTRALFRHLH